MCGKAVSEADVAERRPACEREPQQKGGLFVVAGPAATARLILSSALLPQLFLGWASPFCVCRSDVALGLKLLVDLATPMHGPLRW